MNTTLYRNLGMLPDRYWYQLNGKSATENFREQREKILDSLTDEDTPIIVIRSESK